jgi:hypothetical protein
MLSQGESSLSLDTPSWIFFFFFVVLGLELRHFTLSHSTSPLFCVCEGFFQDRSQELFASGWLQTMILLIFAS